MSAKTIITIAIGILIFSSLGCKENDIVLDFDNNTNKRKIEFAGPFARFNITAIDWLEAEYADEEFLVGPDGLISMSYTEEVFLEWENLVEINDYANAFSFPTVKTNGPLVYQQKIKFNPSADVRYDSLRIANGQLQYTLTAPTSVNGTITISIPEVFTGATTYQRSFNVTPTQRIFNISEPLANKRIKFNQEAGSSYITFTTTIDLTPVNAGDTPGNAGVAVSLTSIIPELTFGYFGQKQSQRLNASLTFTLFNDLELIDEIEFADLKLDIVARNPIGAPFQVKTDNIRLFKEEEPANIDRLEINGTDFVDMDVTTAVFANPIITGTGLYNINRNNSNILTVGNKYPDKLLCDITAWSNPHGEVTPNFMGTETRLQTDLVLKLPFWFRTERYARTDTIDFDFNDMIGSDKEEIEKVELMEIYFDFFNKFPFSMVANAWVEDENGTTIEVLFGDNKSVIKSGIPDTNDKVTKAEHTEFVVGVNNAQIKRFISENAKTIILETKATSYNNGQPFVKIFDQSSLDANISILIKTRLP